MQAAQKNMFYYLKYSIANNMVGYKAVPAEYIAEQIYTKI